MVKGIGVDMVDKRTIDEMDENVRNAFVRRTFSKAEVEEADRACDRSEFLASRYAVKEAVFKALAGLLTEKAFDFRIVETFNRSDGSPYIYLSEEMKDIMEKAKVQQLLVSITTEGDYTVAFVVAA
ncbi:holo-ACP synthase [Hungatella hathewayi]|uniref:holo-ACP synthase n=1 Tax=Hungatella hathewayi TaxID=154046 RepID=UPI00210AA7C9|nr:holo-ACP synthase [Hungatella hathewayi]MCQ5384374.1 holo-ACP synthase [Hungatella hathewayi]